MKPNTLLGLWIVAFSLKAIGASWDASFHFKYLRETTQSSHIVNSIGLVLACLLWIYMARRAEYKLTKPLKVSGLGFLVFFIGIPLDEAWHRIFGIDLTTWSITHAILYTGTALMIAGTILQVEADYAERIITKAKRTMYLLFLMVFVFESFWFPQLQQEQGVLSLYLFDQGTPLASKDILDLLSNPKSQIYGGIPDWLYGVYACFACMVLFRIIRYYKLGSFSCTIVVSIYVGFRVLTNLVYGLVEYPQSTIPYFLILCAVVVDLLYVYTYKLKPHRMGWVVITLGIVCCIYSVTLINPSFPFHPPMPVISAFAAFFSTLFGYGVASFLLHLYENYNSPKEIINQKLLT
ncbi:hypothetical protein EHS13_24640 [Paenibacillus psychroresistens]|uniref:Uncharacterized protein n=1 Tax=Paenibacillus psychroresistens TaxID=1778678 RepID=A0A6B8RPA3_9BACL|nr:hypothetical protein [Paenibacillus psychroresistens]QGQ97849.1 hypothetical protein EHS13_24640 [Paenibacillus psychroresistens]